MKEQLKKMIQAVSLDSFAENPGMDKAYMDGYADAMSEVLEYFKFYFPEVYQEWSDDNYQGPKEIKY